MQNYIFFAQNPHHDLQKQTAANAGAWALEQNLAYTIFIDIHKKSMTSKKKMREIQFYDKLSAFIQTRTSSQSRSHHQKMFDKYKYISKIVELLKGQIGVETYKARFLEGIERMKAIDNHFREIPVVKQEQEQEQEENAEINLYPPITINYSFFVEGNLVSVPVVYYNLQYLLGGYQGYNYQGLRDDQNQM